MKIFEKQADLTSYLKSVSKANTTLGFVPTMGALHDGHLSLLRESIAQNQYTVMSIFVNPTQFNNPEDLEKYPRTLEADVEKIKSVSQDILIYTPSVDDIYHGHTQSERFDFDGLEHQMEGQFRPGHYDGVGTVVKKLFEIVRPTRAYFGEKDFQQLQIVKKMVEKLKIPVEIIGCPIYRENNGLAMSSRNQRLNAEQRKQAAILYKTLQAAQIKFKKNSANTVSKWVANRFEKIPDMKLEYFQIADESELLPCERKNKNKKYRAFIAVFIEKVRLIDTVALY